MADDELIFRTAVDLSGLNDGTEELKAILMSTGEAAAQASAQASAAFSDFGTSIEEAYANVDAQVASALESMNASTEKNAEVIKATSASNADAITSSSAEIEQAFTKVAETTDIVAAAYQQMAVAASVNTQAQAGLKDAYKQLSSSALENGQSAKILAQYEREAASASEQLTLAKRNLAETIAYETELSQGAVVEIQAFAAAEEELAVASSHTATSISAASGLIREFEGHVPIRAVERFIATTLGLGPILQAAFPIIGAVALGEVLIDVAGKVVDLYEKFFTFKELREEVTKEAEADAEKLGHALATAAQLRHETGIRDNPIGTLKKDIADAGQEVDYFNRRIQIAQANLNRFLDIRDGGNYLGNRTSPEENDQNIIAARSALDAVKGQADSVQAKVDDLKSQLNKQTTKADTKLVKADSKADRDRLRAIETQFAELGKVAPGQADHFWSEYLNAFNRGSSEYLTVLQKFNAAREANLKNTQGPGKLDKEWKSEQEKIALIGANGEAAADGLRAVQSMMRIIGEDTDRTGSRWDSYHATLTKTAEAQTAANRALEQAHVSTELATGAITPLAAAFEEQRIHAKAYTEQLENLNAQLERLKAEGSNLHPGESGYEQNKSHQATVQGQIASVQGQQKVTTFNDQSKINAAITQPFRSAFSAVNNDWLSLQGQLIFGTKNIGAAFANMGVSILTSGAATAEKWLAKKAETYLADKYLYFFSNQQKVVSDSTTTAQQTAIASAASAAKMAAAIPSNVAIAESYAAVAAAGAAAATAAIPIVGPALAPAAAASTYAATSVYAALAAYETGGLIPNTGIALVHKGEAVLPEHLTNFLLNMAGSSNTTTHSSSSRINQTNNYNGGSDRQFQRQVDRNGARLLSSIKKHVRGGGKF